MKVSRAGAEDKNDIVRALVGRSRIVELERALDRKWRVRAWQDTASLPLNVGDVVTLRRESHSVFLSEAEGDLIPGGDVDVLVVDKVVERKFKKKAIATTSRGHDRRLAEVFKKRGLHVTPLCDGSTLVLAHDESVDPRIIARKYGSPIAVRTVLLKGVEAP